MLADCQHALDHLVILNRNRGATALSNRTQDEKVSDRSRYPEAIGNRRGVFPRFGLLGPAVERADDRRAMLGLDRHHLRTLARLDPTDALEFVEGFPHADHAG